MIRRDSCSGEMEPSSVTWPGLMDRFTTVWWRPGSIKAYWGLGPVCPPRMRKNRQLDPARSVPRPVCPPRVRKNLTQIDLTGQADHPLQRGDGSPLRPAGRALAPARQHKYDHVHDEHGDESQQNHD